MKLTPKECADFLRRIDAGEETCTVGDQSDWDDAFCGNVTWEFASGWKLTVFNDCYCWDYVDRIDAPDGRYADFDDWHMRLDVRDEHGGWAGYSHNDDANFVRDYEPSEAGKRTLRLARIE